MGLVLAPIVEGKLEEWKSWNAEMAGSMKEGFADLNRRYELTRHEVWLAETPMGPMAVVFHEGPGGDSFMQKMAGSKHPFDVDMAKRVQEFHGMDMGAPPPGPLPVKLL